MTATEFRGAEGETGVRNDRNVSLFGYQRNIEPAMEVSVLSYVEQEVSYRVAFGGLRFHHRVDHSRLTAASASEVRIGCGGGGGRRTPFTVNLIVVTSPSFLMSPIVTVSDSFVSPVPARVERP